MSQDRRESASTAHSLNYTRRESQAWIALPKGHYNVSSGQYMTNADTERAAAGAALYNSSRAKREAKHAELQARRSQLAKYPQALALDAFDTDDEAYKHSVFMQHATPPRPGDSDALRRSPSPEQQRFANDAFDQKDADFRDRSALSTYAEEIERRIAAM